MPHQDPRPALLCAIQCLVGMRLTPGTSGNLSVRGTWRDDLGSAPRPGFYITPTGMAYEGLTVDDLPFVGLDGTVRGRRKPSSEWRLHRDLYAARPEAHAVLHAHSTAAVALACLRREIPPFHYMIARFGGDTVRCAPYATFGTQALSDGVVAAMAGRRGCLMANHGMAVIGESLDQALDLGLELEVLCEQYARACQLAAALGAAGPVLLGAEAMAEALAAFGDYGKQA
ncbi:class II aldolase/adducin family protein [Oryzomicrobium sp.]|uniref:class II aldolase/adducin family protein n=1 Tax=Oryzomicrobium sp. TaxID=1911578 RepID=UPI002FE1E469